MTEASRVRTLIVDDEPLARERIRALLAREPDIEILGEASDGVSAVRKLVEQDFDLLFLDIQMPEMDGFDVLAALDELSREGRASIPRPPSSRRTLLGRPGWPPRRVSRPVRERAVVALP